MRAPEQSGGVLELAWLLQPSSTAWLAHLQLAARNIAECL